MQRIERKGSNSSKYMPAQAPMRDMKIHTVQAPDLGLDKIASGVQSFGKSLAGALDSYSASVNQAASVEVDTAINTATADTMYKLDTADMDTLNDTDSFVKNNADQFRQTLLERTKHIKMTYDMRERVNQAIDAQTEKLSIRLKYGAQKKIFEHGTNVMFNDYKNKLESANSFDEVLAARKNLESRGVKFKTSESDDKSTYSANVIRQSFALQNFDALDKLQESKDGKFTHFPELKNDDRMKLINDGRQMQNRIQEDNYSNYLVQNVNGKDFTIADIKQMYDKRGLSNSGYIALVNAKQKQNYENIVYELGNIESGESFDDQISGYSGIVQSEYDAGNISEKQYNELNSIFKTASKKEKINQLKQQLANTKARNEYAEKKIMADIMALPLLHPKQVHSVRSELVKAIQTNISEPQEQIKMLNFLDKNLNNDPLDKDDNGRLAKAYINDLFKEYIEAGEENDVYVNNWKLDAYYVARQMHAKGANYADIQKKIAETVKFAAEKDIPSILNPNYRIINPAKYGKIYNGPETRMQAVGGIGTYTFRKVKADIPEGEVKVIKQYQGKTGEALIDVETHDGKILKGELLEDYQETK